MRSDARKAIFITGAGSGIGAATAVRFSKEGWLVGLADISASALKVIAAKLPGSHSTIHVMDVRDRDAWKRELQQFHASAGQRLDVLFNNAGIALGSKLAETPYADIERCIRINFLGMVNGAQLGFPYLAATKGSCLLNSCSAAALYGAAEASIYAATKFAIRGFTESLDLEWFNAGIRVRSIMPAFVETPMLQSMIEGGGQDIKKRVLASGLELTSPDDVAAAAWDAVHGDKLHTLVGKTARQLQFGARFFPGLLRRRLQRQPPL